LRQKRKPKPILFALFRVRGGGGGAVDALDARQRGAHVVHALKASERLRGVASERLAGRGGLAGVREAL
jgi:hypothetical protein